MLLRTTTEAVLDDPSLIATEVFGPASIFVEYGDLTNVEAVLAEFEGALTGTVRGGDTPGEDGRRLLDVLVGQVGRVVWNQ